MKTEAKLWEIVISIYREMYSKSTPSADFDKLIESGETKKEEFFNNYKIDQSVYDEIMENQLKGKRLTKYEQQKIRNTVNLGCSPVRNIN